MAAGSALKIAIDLLHVPSKIRLIRSAPLPSDTLEILQIAAREQDVIQALAGSLEWPPHVIEEAASYFIEQILFCVDADSYRVLGATPDATNSELRRNLALLLRWVHPDLDRNGSRASFAVRVNRAWDNLKTKERRRNYDAQHATSSKVLLRSRSRSKRGIAEGARLAPAPRLQSFDAARRHSDHSRRELELFSPVRDGLLRRLVGFLFFRS